MSATKLGMAVALAGLVAGPALADAKLEVRGAAMRLVVIPQSRPDIAITVLKTNARLPIRIRRFGETTFVNGDVGHRIHGCRVNGGRGVRIWGRGVFDYDSLPQVVARVPMDVTVSAGDAVFGDVGRSAALELNNRGCGDWTVSNVSGRARLDVTGSGTTRAGAAGSADIAVAGSGDVFMREVHGPLNAGSSGSGDIEVAEIRGPLTVRIAGSGDVKVNEGEASEVNVSIAGSGGVRFGGVARSLKASIAGSGDVSVAQVQGPIIKHVFGSGEVHVGVLDASRGGR